MRRQPFTLDLQAVVGGEWLRLYDRTPTPQAFAEAAVAAKRLKGTKPDLAPLDIAIGAPRLDAFLRELRPGRTARASLGATRSRPRSG